jgi:roadblock/LC7 domain-containing protein
MNIVFAIIILLGYTIALYIKGGGVPSSLSASVFDLPKSNRWIWTVMLYAVCFLCVPTYVEVTSENTQFLAFIAIAALAFVGAAPLVADKTDMAYKVHCVAAVVCAVCSQMVLVFNQPWLLLCWVQWVLVFVWITKDKPWKTVTFWAEMVCFGSTFAFCLL